MHAPAAPNDATKHARPSGHSGLRALVAAFISLMRGLPLLIAGRPRTPLRVLCLMAFDTVSVLRSSKRLSRQRTRTLAALLDFGACVNDHLDGSGFSPKEYRETRKLLAAATPPAPFDDYVNRLRQLEEQRPSPAGSTHRFQAVRDYRESVVRLSLAAVAATALDDMTIDSAVEAIRHDDDLGTLFRLVMLCQIIDDIFDRVSDSHARLPSFLTATTSIETALNLTSIAADEYAERRLNAPSETLPFRIALQCVSATARLVLTLSHWRLAQEPKHSPLWRRTASDAHKL